MKLTIFLVCVFVFHALGTLAGAYVTARIAASHHRSLALGIGGFFLIGGIMAVQMLYGSPTWFKAGDLMLAYFPMAWIGWKLTVR